MKRYDYGYQCDGESGRCRERMVPTEDGDYVLYTDHAATVAALREDVARLTSAIRWALGEEGEFGEEPLPLAGKYRQRYWWRKELRARAALEGE